MLVSVSLHSGRVLVSALAPTPDRKDRPVFTYPLPATQDAAKRDIIPADVDGDGRLDVVVSDPSRAEFLLLRADEKTFLSTPKRFGGLVEMTKLVAADLDGKGADAIVALSVKEKLIAVSRFAGVLLPWC